MFITVAAAILMVMLMALARALLGPTLYDRILAVNMVGTKTVLLISVMSVIAGRADLVDIALVYALINFIGIIAVLRFFEYSGRAAKVEEGR
jgi:multicomponent Na+:H+ antiporter subunit F